MKRKLLFVVHSWGMGGSENNVKRMSKEAVLKGHDVSVFTNTNEQYYGVNVSSNPNIITDKYDLIFIHGSCSHQDLVIHNINLLKSPIYYAIIEPNNLQMVHRGCQVANWIGVGTSFDRAFVEQYGYDNKAVNYVYGIEPNAKGLLGFKDKYNIKTGKMILSAGGFFPHKRMQQLSNIFQEANLENTTLVLMGYDTRFGPTPNETDNVKCIIGAGQEDVYDAMVEADLYVMNSEKEGYGLCILEAMYNNCPWISMDIAAAHDLQIFGDVYKTENELLELLRTYKGRNNNPKLIGAPNYIFYNHLVEHSLNSILKVLE